MTRAQAARQFARSLFARGPRPGARKPTALGILALEDRIVPQAADIGGLRFEVPGSFNTTADAGGKTYQSVEPIAVGLTPQQGAAFVPLIRLADGGSVLEASDPAQSKFTWANRVDAVTAGGAVTLFSGASESQAVAATLPAATTAVPHAGGQPVPVGAFSLAPTGFRVQSANRLGVAGGLGVQDFGGFTLPVGADRIFTAPTDAGATFALPTIEGGFQLGANPTFSVAGLNFQPQTSQTFPSVGGYARLTRGTGLVEVAGQAQFTLGGSSVRVDIGQFSPTDPAKFVAGAAFQGGSLKSLDATVKTAIALGGLTFQADSLRGNYDAAAAKFIVTGDTRFALAGSEVAAKFGGGATPGIVVSGGRVTSADFAATSTIAVGGVTFKAVNLAATYADATGTYALRGAATFDLKGTTVGVTFGGKSTAGLVVTNGSVTSADFAVDSKIAVGGLTFTATNLQATYTSADSTYTIKGAAAFDLKGSSVGVTFGDKSTAGLVIANGAVTKADFAVDAALALGGVTFTATNLRGTYTAATRTFTVAGAATFALDGSTVAITLGDDKGAGLVIADGALKSFDFLVNSKVVAGGLAFASKGLRATYADASATYTLAGGASTTVAGLGNLDLTLGAQGKPGLVVQNGSVSSIDATLNSDVTLSGVRITTTGLNLSYTAASNLFNLAGGAQATIGGLGNLALTFGAPGKPGVVIQNGALVSLDAALNSDLTVSGVKFTTTGLRLVYTAANSQFALAGSAQATVAGLGTVNTTFGFQGKPGLVIQDGSLSLLDLTLNSDLIVSGVKLTTAGLELTYVSADSKFTLTGPATATIAGLGTLNLAFGFQGKPGLVIQNGSLVSLDTTLNSDVTVAKVRLTTAGLNLSYTAADGKLTLTGPATATIAGLGAVNLIFGSPGKPGLVVQNGALVSLNTTLNSDLTVSGVRLTTTGLELAYTAANSQFALAGSAQATVAGLGNLAVTFGFQGKPGLVIQEGALSLLDLTLNSDLTVSGVRVTTTGLELTYTAANTQFTLAGAATAAIAGLGTVNLTLGYQGKPGLVIQNGSLVSLDTTLNSNLAVSGVTLSTTGLRLTYTAANAQFTLTGVAQATIEKLGNLNVTFGYQGGPGLVIQDGSLAFLDLTLNSNLTVSNVAITTTGLRLTYTAATNQFALAGAAQATIQKFGTVGIVFGFQGKPGLVIRDSKLVSVDVTLMSDVTVGQFRIMTTGLELSYTAADDKFTLSGTTTVSTPQLGSISVTFGYANPLSAAEAASIRDNIAFDILPYYYDYLAKTLRPDLLIAGRARRYTQQEVDTLDAALRNLPETGRGNLNTAAMSFARSAALAAGEEAVRSQNAARFKQGLVVQNGSLVSLDLRINSNFTFLKYTFSVDNLDLSYTAATDTFTIRGKASVDLLLGTFSIQLGDGNGGQGLVVTNGTVRSIDATVTGEVGVAFVSLGKVTLNLKYNADNKQFDISGRADITLAVKLPSPISLFYSGPSVHIGYVQVDVRIISGDNAGSFTKFRTEVSGVPVELKVTFSGDVSTNLSAADAVKIAAKATANAVSGAASSAGKAIGSAATSVYKNTVGKLFSLFDNELAGATLFYDLNMNGVLDPGERYEVSAADGTVSGLEIAVGGGGQLVAFGGVNLGTNLPNRLVLTAPVDATQVSPLTTLVQAVRAAHEGFTEAGVLADLEFALGLPDTGRPLSDRVIEAALGGSRDAALQFSLSVEVALLAYGIDALMGEAVTDGSAVFAALAAMIVEAEEPLDLGDPAVVARLIRDTAGRLGVTLDPALVGGGATVLAGIEARIQAIPALAGPAFMRELDQIELAAETKTFPMLAAAAAGQMDIAEVVAAQTGAAFEAELDGEEIGAVAAPASNASTIYAVGAKPGGGPLVRVYDRQTGAAIAAFFAFEPKFAGGVSVAVGDVTGDGVPDVVVAAGDGGHARVIVIDGTKLNAVGPDGQIDPSAIVASFFAFGVEYTGGASLALARLTDGPGLNIVVGAGAGGGPRVRTFEWTPGAAGGVTQLPGRIGDFFAFEPAFRGGVNVAAGDLDGLGRDDLIVGAGFGGGPVVAVFLPDGTLRDKFFAGDPSLRGGVSVAAGYLDGSSTAQIVTATGPGGPAVVNVYQGVDLSLERSAPVFGGDFAGGATVSVGPTADGEVRLVVGAGPGGGPRVRVLAADDLHGVDDFFAFDPAFRGGVNVG